MSKKAKAKRDKASGRLTKDADVPPPPPVGAAAAPPPPADDDQEDATEGEEEEEELGTGAMAAMQARTRRHPSPPVHVFFVVVAPPPATERARARHRCGRSGLTGRRRAVSRWWLDHQTVVAVVGRKLESLCCRGGCCRGIICTK